MPEDFSYRPRFVDIRIKPPSGSASARAKSTAPEQPEIRQCEQSGCTNRATCRAPKSKTNPDEKWWFCEAHAANYNRNWNFFEGMTDEDLQKFREAEEKGHRPTWSWRASRDSREARTFRNANGPEGWTDELGVFRVGKRPAPKTSIEPRINRIQKAALEVLGLPETADKADVRRTYAELVRRFHPDANGGDRSAEHRLQKVVKAYQALKAAKMA